LASQVANASASVMKWKQPVCGAFDKVDLIRGFSKREELA
jgi:hypothetical protein